MKPLRQLNALPPNTAIDFSLSAPRPTNNPSAERLTEGFCLHLFTLFRHILHGKRNIPHGAKLTVFKPSFLAFSVSLYIRRPAKASKSGEQLLPSARKVHA
jgi:hypothetical protein